ncbi:MAG: mechanosensitive ion channel domain-containing protein [Pseudomonadota bacterium]
MQELLDPILIVQSMSALLQRLVGWFQSPGFYVQILLGVIALFLALAVTRGSGRYLKADGDSDTDTRLSRLRAGLERARPLLLPLLAFVFLGVAEAFSESHYGDAWLLRGLEAIALIALFYMANRLFVNSGLMRRFVSWVLIPIAILYVFGGLGPVIAYLDEVRLTAGNITLSLYTISRVLIFGTILFWLGRKSNDTGKRYIREQEDLDIGTREVFAKLFEIGLFFLIFILLLQVIGVNLTTLAVFGGALGVGLGFGLQSIAANFVSGLILLLDRSLTVGDYVELEDGRVGTIRALNMRSAILKTFDGKDIVVPNETFVTTSFVNWTHEDGKQRYTIELQVAYDTDLEPLLVMLKELVAGHPQVLSGDEVSREEQPDAEISGFGDSGVDLLIEYWMEGIDDGKNRVGADLNMLIWKALKEHKVQIPYPQREIRILGDAKA